MCLQAARWVAHHVDPDQMLHSVCSGMSIKMFRVTKVTSYNCSSNKMLESLTFSKLHFIFVLQMYFIMLNIALNFFQIISKGDRYMHLNITCQRFNPSPANIPCLCKLCISRSVGFWRSQLIWICTVLFAFKYVNLYQQPGSSSLTGWQLEVDVAS